MQLVFDNQERGHLLRDNRPSNVMELASRRTKTIYSDPKCIHHGLATVVRHVIAQSCSALVIFSIKIEGATA
jgi:hypothetical protein